VWQTTHGPLEDGNSTLYLKVSSSGSLQALDWLHLFAVCVLTSSHGLCSPWMRQPGGYVLFRAKGWQVHQTSAKTMRWTDFKSPLVLHLLTSHCQSKWCGQVQSWWGRISEDMCSGFLELSLEKWAGITKCRWLTLKSQAIWEAEIGRTMLQSQHRQKVRSPSELIGIPLSPNYILAETEWITILSQPG
jgi:hypothetical protein